MSSRFRVEVTAKEAEFVLELAKRVVTECRETGLDLSSDTVAERLVTALRNGERNPLRLKALVFGAEAAQAQRAN